MSNLMCLCTSMGEQALYECTRSGVTPCCDKHLPQNLTAVPRSARKGMSHSNGRALASKAAIHLVFPLYITGPGEVTQHNFLIPCGCRKIIFLIQIISFG